MADVRDFHKFKIKRSLKITKASNIMVWTSEEFSALPKLSYLNKKLPNFDSVQFPDI